MRVADQPGCTPRDLSGPAAAVPAPAGSAPEHPVAEGSEATPPEIARGPASSPSGSCYRAVLFDNSGPELQYVAEVTAGRLIEWKLDEVPVWFQVHVLDKF